MIRPEPISVSELNSYIKDKIGNDEFLNNVYIKGEISNFKHHYTGHMYFTLKDENSLIKCIMFKTYTANLNFVPKDGAKVFILGTVSVFERDGVYQIYCKAMQEDGVGDLYTQYEKLKAKLEEEGLFDKQYKKQIPFMPERIGVLTSQTGSVIRDIINVSTRRNPNVYLKLLPVPVQGEGAATKIAAAIRLMNEQKLADVIILARGGGSLEDLWPFNEEIVARAIFESELPIISAVGHETDFTIADFVADLRAPTPSAAAELAVANVVEIKRNLEKYNKRFEIGLTKKLEFTQLKYDKLMNSKVFKEPLLKVQDEYVKLDNHIRNIYDKVNDKYKDSNFKFMNLIAKLDSLSPLKTLGRGYAIAQVKGKVLRSIAEVSVGQEVNVKLIDGTIKTSVTEKKLEGDIHERR